MAMMEYIAAMEDRAEIQDIILDEMENHDRTMTIPATDTAVASTVTENSVWSSSSNLDPQFADMKAAMQKIDETVLVPGNLSGCPHKTCRETRRWRWQDKRWWGRREKLRGIWLAQIGKGKSQMLKV